MGKFKNCFWVNTFISASKEVIRPTDNVDSIKNGLWGITSNSRNVDHVMKNTFIDLNTGKPYNKSYEDIIKDLVEKPADTKLGIICPDGTLRKAKMIVTEKDGCYINLSDTPEQAPPKPGPWKRFVNLFKKKKDLEVQRYNDWQTMMAAGDSLKKLAPRGARTDWGKEVSGTTVEELNNFWDNDEAEAEKKVDGRTEAQKQYERYMSRAEAGDFGPLGIDQARFIRSMQNRLGKTEWKTPNSIQFSGDGTVTEDRVRLYIASVISLRMADDKNVSAEEYGKWNLNDMKKLVTDCNKNGMSLLGMLTSVNRDNGSEVIRQLNKTRQKSNQDLTTDNDEPEMSMQSDLKELFRLG